VLDCRARNKVAQGVGAALNLFVSYYKNPCNVHIFVRAKVSDQTFVNT